MPPSSVVKPTKTGPVSPANPLCMCAAVAGPVRLLTVSVAVTTPFSSTATSAMPLAFAGTPTGVGIS